MKGLIKLSYRCRQCGRTHEIEWNVEPASPEIAIEKIIDALSPFRQSDDIRMFSICLECTGPGIGISDLVGAYRPGPGIKPIDEYRNH